MMERHGVDVDAALLDLRGGTPAEVANATLDVLHVDTVVDGKQAEPAVECRGTRIGGTEAVADAGVKNAGADLCEVCRDPTAGDYGSMRFDEGHVGLWLYNARLYRVERSVRRHPRLTDIDQRDRRGHDAAPQEALATFVAPADVFRRKAMRDVGVERVSRSNLQANHAERGPQRGEQPKGWVVG